MCARYFNCASSQGSLTDLSNQIFRENKVYYSSAVQADNTLLVWCKIGGIQILTIWWLILYISIGVAQLYGPVLVMYKFYKIIRNDKN